MAKYSHDTHRLGLDDAGEGLTFVVETRIQLQVKMVSATRAGFRDWVQDWGQRIRRVTGCQRYRLQGMMGVRVQETQQTGYGCTHANYSMA